MYRFLWVLSNAQHENARQLAELKAGLGQFGNIQPKMTAADIPGALQAAAAHSRALVAQYDPESYNHVFEQFFNQ